MQPERLPPLPEEERRLRKKNNLPVFLLAGVVIGLLGFGMNRLMTSPDSSGAGNTAAVVAPACFLERGKRLPAGTALRHDWHHVGGMAALAW